MYGIFTYIYHQNQLNVGKYTIHGWYGLHVTYQVLLTNLLLPSVELAICFYMTEKSWCCFGSHMNEM